MAYSPSSSAPTAKGSNNNRTDEFYTWEFTTAEASGTSETELTGAPEFGRVVRVICVHSSGAGSTCDPIIGVSTNPSGDDVVWENGTAAATVDEQPANEGAPYYSSGGSLFIRTVADSGSDNVHNVKVLVKRGW